ncbi:MAG: EamA family transporter [Desulfurococcales archaeon]|nr:EamA family transporter [Desulfurococcales archaeon]
MAKWLLMALATLVLWGFWGVALKLASKRLDWKSLYIISNMVIVAVVAVLLITRSIELPTEKSSLGYALIAGVCGTSGYILLILSMKAGGKASIVIPLTSLYPALTVILSKLLLQEPLNRFQVIGIALALIAIVLLSVE